MRFAILASLLLLIPCSLLHSQDRQGSLKADLGIGIGVYTGTVTETDANGNTIEEKDTATASLVPIRLEYGLTDWLGAGIVVQPSDFIANPDLPDHIKVDTRGLQVGLYANYYFVNKATFESHLHLGFGAGRIDQDRENLQSDNEAQTHFTGTDLQLGAGLRWYLIGPVGIFVDPRYHVLSYELENFKVNGKEQDIDGSLDFDMSGLELKLGIGARF